MKRWLPIALFLLAFGVRLLGSTHTPPSPYWEEVALGYDAYSILKTGMDHHGNRLPLVAFPSFGDYKPSLYFYSLIPSVAIFGLSTFAIRLPAALFSSLTALVLYFLMRKWSGEKVAFWSTVLLTFQPWSWQVGRVGFETNLSAFLILLAAYCLSKAFDVRPSRPNFLRFSLLSATLFSLSMYAYHGARLLAPVFALALFLIHYDWRQPRKMHVTSLRSWLPAVVLAIVVVSPILLALKTPVIQQRIAETSVFSLLSPIEQSNRFRELSGNTLPSRILYHRYWFWGKEILSRYVSHLSPAFLLLTGDENPRHTSKWFGALYPWEFLTLAFGIVYGRKHFREKKWWFGFLALAFLSPLAAAFTVATPHALRALPLSPWLAAISAIGVVEIIDRLKGAVRQLARFWEPAACGILILSWLVLAFYYFSQYRIAYASEWQYGYQELFDTLVKYKRDDEKVFVSRAFGRPAMYFFFTRRIDPLLVQAEEEIAQKDQLERLTFQEWSFIDGESREPGLHAQPFRELPEGASPLDILSGLDGKPLWIIYRH